MKIVVNNKQGYKIYRNYFGRWGLRGVPHTGPANEPMYFDFSNVGSTGREVNITPKDNNINFEYSFDRVTWTSWVSGNNIVVDGHDKVWLRGSNNALGQSNGDLTKFNLVASGVNVAVGGNIMSLLYGSSFTGNETTFPTTGGCEFRGLFQSCQYLRDASGLILPVLTLNTQCYHDMFLGSSLVLAPTILPATTLAPNCYTSMFNSCGNLETTPILPATTLVTDCYDYMFYTDSKINYIKCLTTNPSYGFSTNWVTGVAATGTFVKKAGVTWDTGNWAIPSGWTVVEE